jgi:hypothetical protein
MGMLFIAWETEKKLRTMKMTVMMLGTTFVKPSLNLSVMVKQISKNPASRRKIQAIDIFHYPFKATAKQSAAAFPKA